MTPREQFELFVARAEELRRTRLVAKGFEPGIRLRWDAFEGLRFQSSQPDEEALRSFLLTFRQFVSRDGESGTLPNLLRRERHLLFPVRPDSAEDCAQVADAAGLRHETG